MPTPVVALNRAVAVAEVAGPQAGLAAIDELELTGYYLYHSARAEMLGRLGRRDEAIVEFDAALGSTANSAEREFLERRKAAV